MSVNTITQRTILLIYAIAVFILCVLCVPWKTEQAKGSWDPPSGYIPIQEISSRPTHRDLLTSWPVCTITRCRGWSPLFIPPDDGVSGIDWSRLSAALVALTVVCGTALAITKGPK